MLLGLLWGKVWKETEDLGMSVRNEAKAGTSLAKWIQGELRRDVGFLRHPGWWWAFLTLKWS